MISAMYFRFMVVALSFSLFILSLICCGVLFVAVEILWDHIIRDTLRQGQDHDQRKCERPTSGSRIELTSPRVLISQVVRQDLRADLRLAPPPLHCPIKDDCGASHEGLTSWRYHALPNSSGCKRRQKSIPKNVAAEITRKRTGLVLI